MDALPPLPVVAVLVGEFVAEPDDPVFPPLAVLLEFEVPEEALPVLDGLDVAEPVLPVSPEGPDCAEPELEPWPEPPVVVVEAAAEWDSTAWTNRNASAPMAKAMATFASASQILCITFIPMHGSRAQIALQARTQPCVDF